MQLFLAIFKIFWKSRKMQKIAICSHIFCIKIVKNHKNCIKITIFGNFTCANNAKNAICDYWNMQFYVIFLASQKIAFLVINCGSVLWGVVLSLCCPCVLCRFMFFCFFGLCGLCTLIHVACAILHPLHKIA